MRKNQHLLCGIIIYFCLLIGACTVNSDQVIEYGNKAEEGFNLADSDQEAIDIADQVMEAMGGRKNWDETRYLKWNFFGSRRHVWDRYTGDIIVEGMRDSFLSKININTLEGSVNLKGTDLTKADSLDKYVEKTKGMWINDSYWLIFPFKMKDSGVTLKYAGIDTTVNGSPAHVLEMTFSEVGNTPQNKYCAYVDTSTMLVNQWDYYKSFDDSIPQFKTTWSSYEEHGLILLSSGRGDKYKITEISTHDTLARYFNQ